MASGVSARALPARLSRSPATVVFIVALVASGVTLIALTTRATFFLDEWSFLLHRRGFGTDTLLDPHNEHIAILPILIYKGLLATFGMDSARPFQVVSTLMFLVSASVLFVWLRRRVGAWLSLAALLPVLFLGNSWIDLLWPFQLAFSGSMACGIGALLLLERDEDRLDPMGCVLLTVSVAFNSLALPFVVAATVLVAWRGPPRSRLYVPAVPLAFYVLWWLGWGHNADAAVTLYNLAKIPAYVLDGISSSVSSILGLATDRNDVPEIDPLDWGRPLMWALIALAAYLIYRRGAGRGLCVTLALLGSFWAFGGVVTNLFRGPTNDRYVLIGAIFVLMVAAELARGVRPRPPVVIAALAVSVVATASNMLALNRGADFFDNIASATRGGLTGLEIARGTVSPGFVLNPDNSNGFYADIIDARSYLSAVDAFGSPAYTPQELVGASEIAHAAADKVLAATEGAQIGPAAGVTPSGDPPAVAGPEGAVVSRDGACVTVNGGDGADPVIVVPPTGLLLRQAAQGGASASLRRFSTQSFPVDLGKIGSGERRLQIAPDAVNVPWQLRLENASAPVRVCGADG